MRNKRTMRTGLHILFFFAVSTLLVTAGVREVTLEVAPSIHVIWRDGLAAPYRRQLEVAYALSAPVQVEGTNWAYDLLDTSAENIRALLGDPAVADTLDLNGTDFRVSGRASRGAGTSWLANRTPWLRSPERIRRMTTVPLAIALLSGLAILAQRRRSKAD